jgi:hypothetical protein
MDERADFEGIGARLRGVSFGYESQYVRSFKVSDKSKKERRTIPFCGYPDPLLPSTQTGSFARWPPLPTY